jgi:hypothetical protein
MDHASPRKGENTTLKELSVDVLLAGIHRAVEGLNAAAAYGLHAAVADGLLVPADALSETRNQ